VCIGTGRQEDLGGDLTAAGTGANKAGRPRTKALSCDRDAQEAEEEREADARASAMLEPGDDYQ
jgi:hypothetical protein